MMGQNHTIARLRYRLTTFASTRPSLYYGIRRMTNRYDDLCVNDQTELVIEGFPRSANSTTVHKFMERQRRQIQIAHHKHHAVQLLRAVERGLPAMMLVRDPLDAVVSLLALQAESFQRTGIAPRRPVHAQDALHGWVKFYSAMLPHCDKIVVAPFDVVTRDISQFIRQLNERFATDFIENTQDQGKAEPSGWHALPNSMRTDIISKSRAEIAQQLTKSDNHLRRLRYAQDLHQALLEFT